MNLIGCNISNLSKSKENASGWKWIHLTFGPLQSCNSVPDAIMKFSLNALLDTLPHRHNLSKWGKSQTSACPLCSENQLLIHVLNSCSVALQQRRFDQRHDAVLKIIADFIRSHMPHGFCVTADLPSEEYIRPQFLVSDLRPDIIMWSTASHKAYLLELTV